MRRSYTVACLAGDGLGPELMAEASRTLHRVSRLHGFHVDDVHVPFGTEALTRAGHPLPVSTRAAYLEADAVLVAAAGEPALEGVESELDLRAQVTRLVFAGGGFTLLTPLGEDLAGWTIERAFESARSSRARLASVDHDEAWQQQVDAVAENYDGVAVEHLSVSQGLPALAFQPERFDVVVTGPVVAPALEEIASMLERDARVVARGRLAGNGPAVFGPLHDHPDDIAGHGVADPSSILLAVSLLLGEGLGERAAARTLAVALTSAQAAGPARSPTAPRRIAASTREFADAVLELLPSATRNAEFLPEAVR
jgi:3-isopropylmalate dehydrogenase